MFCRNCGAPRIPTPMNNYNAVSSQAGNMYNQPAEAFNPVQETQKWEDKVFVSPEEKTVAVLGGGYLNNFLKTGSLNKGFCVVSQKNVYFKGRCYSMGNKSISKFLEESMVDLKDVTGTGFMQRNPILLLIIGIIALLVAAIFLFKSFSDSDNLSSMTTIGFIGFVFLILYNFLKVKVFEISYAGGNIVFDANDFSYAEIVEFQKKLRIAIDNRNEEIYQTIRKTIHS